MANILQMIQLIPAIQVVFKAGFELTDQDFVELTPAQYEAYRRKMPPTKERIYRFTLEEPSAIERTPEKVTYEISIASESEKAQILEAVKFLKSSAKELDKMNPTFAERLEYLRKRFPPEVTGMPRD